MFLDLNCVMEKRPFKEEVDKSLPEPVRIGVVGSRDWNRVDLIARYLDDLQECYREVVLVTGTNPDSSITEDNIVGADQLAVLYAKQYHLPCVIYEADWNKYGVRAGPQRNTLIANDAQMVLAFWDEKSKGTRDILTKAVKRGIQAWVITASGEYYQYPKTQMSSDKAQGQLGI